MIALLLIKRPLAAGSLVKVTCVGRSRAVADSTLAGDHSRPTYWSPSASL